MSKRSHITTIHLYKRHQEWLKSQEDFNLSENVRRMIDEQIDETEE